jgi:hypothetical protein
MNGSSEVGVIEFGLQETDEAAMVPESDKYSSPDSARVRCFIGKPQHPTASLLRYPNHRPVR